VYKLAQKRVSGNTSQKTVKRARMSAQVLIKRIGSISRACSFYPAGTNVRISGRRQLGIKRDLFSQRFC
jgi:hypothetical protein